MQNILKFSTLVFLLLSGFNLSAQNFYKERQSRDVILNIGIGPSIAYLDNGGTYKKFDFEVRPSISAALNKRLNKRFDLRATGGLQWITSGGHAGDVATNYWTANNSSFTAVGSILYFDVMPSVYLIPFENHMDRSKFNLYGGVGIGIMQASTEQTKSFSEDAVSTKENVSTGYIPIRAGLTYRIGPFSDLAIEGTMQATFSDNLDGNVGYNKHNDRFFQGQLVFRRYFFSNFDQ